MKWVVRALKVAVEAGILGVLFHQVGAANVWQALTRLDGRVFVGAVVGYCVMQSVKPYRLQLLLRAVDVEVRYPRLLGLYYIGMFFNTVLPSIVGGDAVRAAYLYRDTRRLGRVVAATLTERATGVTALIAIALVALAASPHEASPGVACAVLAVSAAFTLGMLLLFSPWVYRVGMRCMRALRLGRVADAIGALQVAFNVYRRQRGVLVVTLLLSFALQLAMVALYALLAHGMGLHLSPWLLLMAVPVTVLVSMAPVTLGGLGVREVTWVLLLSQHGVPQADAIALSLMWFVVVTVSSLFGAPVFLLWGKPPTPDRPVQGTST